VRRVAIEKRREEVRMVATEERRSDVGSCGE
jgi:hypothetical protein